MATRFFQTYLKVSRGNNKYILLGDSVLRSKRWLDLFRHYCSNLKKNNNSSTTRYEHLFESVCFYSDLRVIFIVIYL